jgi:hypothetical protein
MEWQLEVLGYRSTTNAVNGVITGLRTRISPPDDGNARCRVSKAGD